MSTTVQQASASATASERRFYSRFVPQAPICIAIDGKTEGLLLNISENGLLVSTLTELPCNFVTQISIPLNGLPKPLQVNVRVVWSSETRMLAGIQLINLSEYDREQIRMWGAHTSSALQPRENSPHWISTKPSSAGTEKVAARSGLLGAPAPPAKAPAKPPVVAAVNSVAAPAKRFDSALAHRPVEKPATAKQEASEFVASRSQWRKLKWPLIVAALLLSGLFLLASGALVNPFSHSAENREESGPAARSVMTAEQNPQASLPNKQFPLRNPPENVTPPVNNFVSSNKVLATPLKSLAKTDSHAARDSTNGNPAQSKAVPPVVTVPRIENVHPLAESARSPAAKAQPDHSVAPARQNPRLNSQADSAASARNLATTKIVEKPKRDNSTAQTGNVNTARKNQSASGLPPAAAARNKLSSGLSASKGSVPATAIASIRQPVGPEAPRNSLPSKLAVGPAAATSETPISSASQPIETDAARNTIASNDPTNSSVVASTPSNSATFPPTTIEIPARPGVGPAKPVAPVNPSPSLSSVIQMDTPGRRMVQLRVPSGSENSFLNIPGERRLQSSSITMHIQRSVRLPEEHSGWLFHSDKEKKVAVGDLVSRIDPQVPASQLAGDDFVQVRARIAEDGSVESVKPLHGAQSLVPVVLKAVHGWHFQPTLVDGQAVETQSDVLVQFHPPLRRATP